MTLAFCIALFPPIWAVIAPNINVSTGAVALICAGLYVTNGNKSSDAVKISIGFLLGDFWAVFALKIMDVMNFNADMELFITLFVLGGLAVLISACLPKWIFTPAWLCGWAVGLTILAPIGWGHLGSINDAAHKHCRDSGPKAKSQGNLAAQSECRQAEANAQPDKDLGLPGVFLLVGHWGKFIVVEGLL